MEAILDFVNSSGFALFAQGDNWKCLVMLLIACGLLYLGIVKKFEPLLLVPIAFGMLITNLPGAEMYHEIFFAGGHIHWDLIGGAPVTAEFLAELAAVDVSDAVLATATVGQSITPGLIDILYLGVKLGIFMTFVGCRMSGIFSSAQAGSIGIIGGADGPTAIYGATKLAPELLGPIAVAAYSYMALVPVIQPPIMRLLTTEAERKIVMKPLRQVSKTEKIVFPIMVAVFVALLVPSAAPLIACLMLGNLFKECGAVERLSKTVQNELINIVTIFLGVSVGATATGRTFLSLQTIAIMLMGIVAFGFGTAGGVVLAKIMNLFLKEKINPLIGSAGVSAVPMAARVSQVEGQKANPSNFLLMHAMGPNVAGVIGSAIAAGVMISLFG